MSNISSIIIDYKNHRYLIPLAILAENISCRALSHCPTQASEDQRIEHIVKWIGNYQDPEVPIKKLFDLYPKGTNYILKSCLYENKD